MRKRRRGTFAKLVEGSDWGERVWSIVERTERRERRGIGAGSAKAGASHTVTAYLLFVQAHLRGTVREDMHFAVVVVGDKDLGEAIAVHVACQDSANQEISTVVRGPPAHARPCQPRTDADAAHGVFDVDELLEGVVPAERGLRERLHDVRPLRAVARHDDPRLHWAIGAAPS